MSQNQLEELTKDFQLVLEGIEQKLVLEDVLVSRAWIHRLLCVIQNDSEYELPPNRAR
jgi:hypothetical protein